jgi:DNA modification methylase
MDHLRTVRGWTTRQLAESLGASPAAIVRWDEGSTAPSPEQIQLILKLSSNGVDSTGDNSLGFCSRGVRKRPGLQRESLFDGIHTSLTLLDEAGPPIIERLMNGSEFRSSRSTSIAELFAQHQHPADTASIPPTGGMSAGKNTYTYDAHTYHTKVPPQGIAELLRHYLPNGGLVADPFAGSGMTGVAAAVLGYDCILNELSPAACFIESQFVASPSAQKVGEAVSLVMEELSTLRRTLYSTECRECGRTAELLYTVWSYRVHCPDCFCEFNLWDACRSYGRTVREHKILSEFPCPKCNSILRKSKLERSFAEPVQIGYKCCGSRQTEVTHPPSTADLELIGTIEASDLVERGWYPTTELWDGVNLGQPRRHGLTSVDRFYTKRNLSALSHIWKTIHRIEDPELAAQVAFVFTSLYRRVTKFSEFRFWGGSGNSARLNVPFIYDEPNVFVSFERKARTINDHLVSTASHFSGRVVIRNGSATDLSEIPDSSVDVVFTDPPFGSNINYSEMNLLWESWLGRFTDATEEAIVNKVQGKDLGDYQKLMAKSLEETFRILRPGHWMLLVFMNSSARVWQALETTINEAGFVLVKADIFDKQHGTFKHFVSPNTAGADLVLHCLKPLTPRTSPKEHSAQLEIEQFLEVVNVDKYLQSYLHVSRPTELDLRKLYSEWVAEVMVGRGSVIDFADFRTQATRWLERTSLD